MVEPCKTHICHQLLKSVAIAMLLNVANHGSIWLFKNLQKIHGANEQFWFFFLQYYFLSF